jgi:hypothetical protein
LVTNENLKSLSEGGREGGREGREGGRGGREVKKGVKRERRMNIAIKK